LLYKLITDLCKYMSSKKIPKIEIKKEYIEELSEIYPNAFEIKEKNIKVKSNLNKFYKKMIREKEYTKWIIKNLWITYIWYLEILLQSLDYENRVKFETLSELWIKPWMLSVVKKKFIESEIIKKYQGDFYISPMIAIKWEKINPDLINIFTNLK